MKRKSIKAHYLIKRMRNLLKNHLKYRKRPLVMAHAGGLSHGRENSKEAVKSSLKFNPDIIEIDARKSKDNVLFCCTINSLKNHILLRAGDQAICQ